MQQIRIFIFLKDLDPALIFRDRRQFSTLPEICMVFRLLAQRLPPLGGAADGIIRRSRDARSAFCRIGSALKAADELAEACAAHAADVFYAIEAEGAVPTA